MNTGKKLLIVDDNEINREVLNEILNPSYTVIEATNGREALEILNSQSGSIAAIMTDIVMPKMDGFQLIEEVHSNTDFADIPIIAMTSSNDSNHELTALQKGAWDFVTKPFNEGLILTRLANAIAKSEVDMFKKISYLARHDEVTGIYNKRYFLQKTNELLKCHKDKKFVFVFFDIDKLQLINSFYGEEESNKLVVFVGQYLLMLCDSFDLFTYGRIGTSSFAMCLEYDEKHINGIMSNLRSTLEEFSIDYDVECYFGLYVIEDNSMSGNEIFSKANLAFNLNDNNYLNYYSYYSEDMTLRMQKEQQFINDLQTGLDNEEFQVYLQPKYNIQTNKVSGAEALVRWNHRTNGLIPPSEFIPVFEKNGFIAKLDYYMWEHVCILLNRWINMGKKPLPISVNVSRVNIYNSRVVSSLIDLVEKYEIQPWLLELEVTESAYSDNPAALIKIVNKLKDYGFTILMDDFGSGYSSLSILKDIEVDILKIDLGFLGGGSDSGRGENIIASIIRMAKWLKIPVIVEGVETASQVAFLRTVGCDFVQGYYYAKPVSTSDFELLVEEEGVKNFDGSIGASIKDDFDMDTLFQSNPQMKVLFGNLLQALAIFEFNGQNLEYVRVNEGYYDVFGPDDPAIKSGNPLSVIDVNFTKIVTDTFKLSVSTRGRAECDFVRKRADGTSIWVNLKLRFIRQVGDSYLVLGLLDDVTSRKKIDFELDKYRKAVIRETRDEYRMLVVDDVAANRAILKKIFEKEYTIIEACDGMEAMEILREDPEISIILLDIVMPRMNGWEFLEHKKKDDLIADIPVIVITAESKYNEQMNALDLGTKDYIIKPFVPDIVRKRVGNVMDSIRFVSEMLKKYDEVSQKSKFDSATGLYNMDSAVEMINTHLKGFPDNKNAMILFKINDFYQTNENTNNIYVDSLTVKVVSLLKDLFRGEDIAFRSSDNIFSVFAKDFKNEEMLVDRCNKFIKLMEKETGFESYIGKIDIGIAYSPNSGNNFATLIKCASMALTNVKDATLSGCSIYKDD